MLYTIGLGNIMVDILVQLLAGLRGAMKMERLFQKTDWLASNTREVYVPVMTYEPDEMLRRVRLLLLLSV